MQKQTGQTYDQVLAALPDILKSEGFGIITEIDMRQTLKNKIGAEIRRYKILGACNPKLALQALEQDSDIGFMLPGNVAVYERDDGGATVTTMDPVKAMAGHPSPGIAALATTVREKLERVLAKVG